jgi:hypothetical protein
MSCANDEPQSILRIATHPNVYMLVGELHSHMLEFVLAQDFHNVLLPVRILCNRPGPLPLFPEALPIGSDRQLV